MPTLPSPAYGEAGAVAPRRSRRRSAQSALLVRLRVAVHHEALDTALAQGSDWTRRPELALRATQLQRRRHRHALARSLRRVVDEASGSRPPVRATAVVIARKEIVAQADDVLLLADRLDSPRPAHATGIAIARRLVTDGLESPLYAASEGDTLRRLSRHAVAEMDGRAGQPSE